MEYLQTTELEDNVLGGILLDNTKYDSVSFLSGKEFTGINKEIWRAIRKGLEAGDPVNIATLIAEPDFKKHYKKISHLTSNAISTNTVYFAEKLVDANARIKTKRVLEEAELGLQNNLPTKRVLSDLEQSLSEISYSRGYTVDHAKDILEKALDKVMEDYNSGGVTGVPTGYDVFDDNLGGLHKQEMIIIGARPSVGKTAIALNIANNVIRNGRKVGFISLEMSSVMLLYRLLCSDSRVNRDRIKSGELNEKDFELLKESCSYLMNSEFYLYDHPNADLFSVKAKAREMKRKGVEVLFIDYLGLVRVEGVMPRWEKMGIVSSELKALARELDTPVVVLSQVGRQSEDHEPTLADLRDSGAIEQDADVVIFLHRGEGDDVLVKISKNRNGRTGSGFLKFIKSQARFIEKDQNF